jgi:hypothetical protein
MITFLRLGRYGQIGNQMFQIAGTMGIATRQNERYAFPEWHNYDGVDKGNMSAEDSHIEPWFTMPLPRITPTEIARCRHLSVPWGYHPRFRAHTNADLLGLFVRPNGTVYIDGGFGIGCVNAIIRAGGYEIEACFRKRGWTEAFLIYKE